MPNSQYDPTVDAAKQSEKPDERELICSYFCYELVRTTRRFLFREAAAKENLRVEYEDFPSAHTFEDEQLLNLYRADHADVYEILTAEREGVFENDPEVIKSYLTAVYKEAKRYVEAVCDKGIIAALTIELKKRNKNEQ